MFLRTARARFRQIATVCVTPMKRHSSSLSASGVPFRRELGGDLMLRLDKVVKP
jgi:hypothetical protein